MGNFLLTFAVSLAQSAHDAFKNVMMLKIGQDNGPLKLQHNILLAGCAEVASYTSLFSFCFS